MRLARLVLVGVRIPHLYYKIFKEQRYDDIDEQEKQDGKSIYL